jgi:hypothetical protein
VTALVQHDAQTRRDSLQREVRRSDNDVIAAWRALVQAPALQAAQLRSEIDAVAHRAVGGVRHELRAVVNEALRDHALLALGAAFVVGAWAGQRR